MPDDAQIQSLNEASHGVETTSLPDAEHFVRRYYLLAGPDDLAGRPRETLARIALNHLNLGARRGANETKLRVFTPRQDADGWRAPCSVIEIVTDDMPFLLDSTTSALSSMGIGVREVVHPILRVRRDASGSWLGLADEDAPGDAVLKESFIHIETEEQPDDALAALTRHLTSVLADVRAAVGDWELMRAKVGGAAEYLSVADLPVPDAERDEAVAFLNWLADDNFTLLGYREYKLVEDADGLALTMLPTSGLGILRDPDRKFLRDASGSVRLPAEIAPLVLKPEALIVTKSSVRATVHRTTHMDHIGVKTFGPDGRVAGERRIIGLFTSSAYHRSARQIPLIRRKVRQVVERAGFAANSHDGKALANILEMFPRDELFQLDPTELYDIAVGILRLETRPAVKLFFRRDPFGRFLSVLAYIPRERFATALRIRISEMLETALGGPATVISTAMGESPLARVHLFVQTDPSHLRDADFDALQARARLAARTWDDDLADALATAYAEDQDKMLFRRYAGGFSASYREAFTPASAVDDIGHIEPLTINDPLGFRLGRDREDGTNIVRFKLYRLGPLVPLSDCLPVLENLGFRVLEERPFSISRGDADDVSVHEFVLADATGHPVDVEEIAQPFAQAFARVWSGDAENDGFNRLVVRAGLGWRDVVVLRACAKHLRQAGVSFSQAYIEDTLVAHPDTAQELVALFRARFDPATDESMEVRETRAKEIVARIEAQIDTVSSLDEDRILHRYANLIGAMVRTNFYQPAEDGGLQPTLSFKLDSQRVDGLPAPRPMFEVFVYSPRFEAIHLRGGRVARGGIRWSDRREDFRTEILALMKAQQVKNAVIVPVGAKGGFVPKRLPTDESRDAVLAEAVACYRLFMDALLDLTDTIDKGTLIPPKDVVRHDGDDPYLVVAADKGTATFSDIANGIAEEHGYWLGDAFASGGSAGYDHKAMGITARGAWESVKRHFYEMDLDTQSEPFRVVGVGDMSGDVFGNGMLQSECIRLVAAFDHRHVFIDPDPDPAASFAERRRLYDLPRSSWGDYDAGLISQGGGVFPRTAKSIPLSPEVRRLTGLDVEHAAPAELIKALLTAEVDLLWFGGIGTYVKASDESHAEAGDRANDGLRVDGRQLRACVVGEGANLACTQRGRIEYATGGGRINMDAIDNAAGVDCSDHEVNIKIALRPTVEDERITLEARNALLTDMTDDVAALVLRDNVLQSRAISLEHQGGRDGRDWLVATMRALEREGRLDRAVEYLPGEEELTRRATADTGLTRPEIAILLSYAKLALNDALIQDAVPDEPHFLPDLEAYFPRRLHEGFPGLAARHPLHREIVATVLANEIVNRCGIAFVTRLREESGAEAGDVARAYALTRAAFHMSELWDALDRHDLHLPAERMLWLYADLRDFMHRQTLWVLRNLHHPIALDAAISTFVPEIAQLSAAIEDVVTGSAVAETLADYGADLRAFGLSPDLARALANLRALDSAFDIVQTAQRCGRPIAEAARAYFRLGATLGLDRLKASIARIETEDHWEARALQAEVEDLYAAQRALTAEALSGTPDREAVVAVRQWLEREDAGIARAQRAIADLEASGPLTLPKLTLAGRLLRGLTGT